MMAKEIGNYNAVGLYRGYIRFKDLEFGVQRLGDLEFGVGRLGVQSLGFGD